jgi:hypothetical protein
MYVSASASIGIIVFSGSVDSWNGASTLII